MTEAEWLACEYPQALLQFLQDKASYRKIKLVGCAFCRRVWHLLIDERSRRAVEVSERFADGLASEVEQEEVYETAALSAWDVRNAHEGKPPHGAAYAAFAVCSGANTAASGPGFAIRGISEAEAVVQCALLRCVFGNPFRPVNLDPSWLNPTVSALAEAVYNDRHLPSGELDPQRRGVLADALEDAGASGELVEHLRGTDPHVRGCFAVDLLLAKE